MVLQLTNIRLDITLNYFNMKNIKAWKTTTIGLILIFGAMATVYLGKTDWSGALIAISTGVGLLFAPDTMIDKMIK